MAKSRLDHGQLDAILIAVARTVAKRGTENFRLTDAAAEAGVSIGTLQHYFGSRDDLIATAFRAINARDAQLCRELANPNDDPRQQIAAVIDNVMSLDKADWMLWTEFWSAGARSTTIRNESTEIYRRWVELFGDVIDAGLEGGYFVAKGTGRELAPILISYGDGLAVQIVMDRLSPQRAREMFRDIAQRLLGFSFDGVASNGRPRPRTKPLG